MRTALPIDVIREKILTSLEVDPFLILSAPTGSGKSTRVPQFLFESGKFPETIYILEPRVLAARLLAERVASELGVRLGEEVGYRTRHDTKCSPKTRVVFVTEGLFFRLLKDNPELKGISAVLLDEFHERNIDSDLVLSYLKDAVPRGGGKTRVVVMSATLETEGLKKFLGAPHLETGGKLFPVEIEHFPAPGGRTDPGRMGEQRAQRATSLEMWDHAALAVRKILENEKSGSTGDGLVFMPGLHEIRKTIQAIENAKLPEPVTCFALHGEMNPDEQREVLGKISRRKIIVATNVAETSLTLEGVTWVVDAGWARVARFHPGKNIDLLVLERISLSSATQRAGRAGRMAPGVCLRLWSQAEELRFSKTTDPEIRRVDLAETVLQAKSLGQSDLEKFPWFEAPEKKSLDQAQILLKLLGSLREDGGLSPLGDRMSRLPMPPRLSRFAIEAEKRNVLGEALLWAAILGESSFLIRGRYKPERGSRFRSDFTYLSELLHRASAENFRFDFLDREGIHGVRARRVLRTFQLYARLFENRRNAGDASEAEPEITSAGEKELADLEASLIRSLLPAFPDRVAVKDHDASSALELSGKRRGRLSDTTHVRASRVVLVSEMIEIQTRGSQDTIFDLLSALEPKWILEAFPDSARREEAYVWNEADRRVDAEERLVFQGLPIEKSELKTPNPSRVVEALVDAHLAGKFQLSDWGEKIEAWIRRVRFVAREFPEKSLSEYSPDDLRVILAEIFEGGRSAKDVKDRPCFDAVKFALSWEDQNFVESMAPESLTLDNGLNVRIQYADQGTPTLSAKLQKLYDTKTHPVVAGGKVKVLVDLLAPNQRTLQKTLDLPGFWSGSYPQIRKEMAGRYPKHEWR